MIPNEKIGVLNAWRNDIFGELSISEIMVILNKKTKTWVFNTLKILRGNGILNSQRKGNVDIYSLNLKNPLSIKLLSYLEAQEILDFPQLGVIGAIIERAPIENYALLIFGSYAEGKQKKVSDLDICFLIESKETEKKIKPYLNEIKLDYAVKIEEQFITFKEFSDMLLRKEENLGKQIFRKHRIFYHPDTYYKLIKEAQKNGFRP
jgi:predicted nucleotidyltransferase